jgi:glycosyltransferase involved in cell wall biosynthesis
MSFKNAMRWTIGMPSYNNFTEVYFTLQALRMYHDMRDKEIIVVDNFGDKYLEKFIKEKGGNVVRYERATEIQGVSYAKNRIFDTAKGEFVLVIDSHILLKPGCFDVEPSGNDFIQGPLLINDCFQYWYEWLPVWRANMWGIWGEKVGAEGLPRQPIDIWAMGAGFFATRRDSWLGFNEKFRGFGGETGYIQEKYRKAGRRVICYPNMVWLHYFCNTGRKIPFKVNPSDRIRNYLIGFAELGLDINPIINHFGKSAVESITKKGL